MSGLEQRAHEEPGSSDVRQLVDDYRRQQELLKKQSDDLSRLLERVLGTADRESKEILSSAQAEIKRILVTARRDLLELSAQIELMRKAHQGAGDPRFDEALERASTAISERRYALHELLREARASLAEAEPHPDESRAAESPANESHAFESHAFESHGVESHAGQLHSAEPRGTGPAAPEEAPAPIRPMRALFAPAGPPPRVAPAVSPARTVIAAAPSPFESPVRFSPPSIVDLSPIEAKLRKIPLPDRALAPVVGLGAVLVVGMVWWLWSGNHVNAGRVRLQPAPASAPAAAGVHPDQRADAAAAAASTAAKRVLPLSVAVSATRRVWVRASVDGKTDDGHFMEAGTTRNFDAKNEVSLRAGDAGAVRVSVNDAAAEPLGHDGETVTRRFATPSPVPSSPPASSPPAVVAPAAASPTRTDAAFTAQPAHEATDVRRAQPSAPPATAPAAVAGEPPELAARVAQWIDAYARRDTGAMAGLSMHDATVSDNRRSEERGAPNARTSLDSVHVQLAGEQAVLSGKLIESDPAGRGRPQASWISQMWTRQNGVWLLMDARIRAEGRPQ